MTDAIQPPGRRSGEGAASVLPPLNEDEAQRPGKEPPPANHPEGASGGRDGARSCGADR